MGDKSKIYTVLNNYISNAASHADGERIVRVGCRTSGGVLRVSVYNTGKTIDEQDSEKLFMSFYRGDKAHSRSEGRFGLGLSIVKAIMDVHKKPCGFENKPDGVEFWFELDFAPEQSAREN